MIRALFGVEIKDCALVIGELCGVAQYFTIDERSPDNGGDIEGLLLLALPVDAEKLPRVPITLPLAYSTSGAV